MKAEIKQLWIDALRSGKYQQGTGALRIVNEYCCLGVLCDLHAQAGLGQWNTHGYDGDNTGLPESVREWADIEQRYPKIDGVDITFYNDGSCQGMDGEIPTHSFTQIANLIEQHL
jgi:hypothetical protein